MRWVHSAVGYLAAAVGGDKGQGQLPHRFPTHNSLHTAPHALSSPQFSYTALPHSSNTAPTHTVPPHSCPHTVSPHSSPAVPPHTDSPHSPSTQPPRTAPSIQSPYTVNSTHTAPLNSSLHSSPLMYKRVNVKPDEEKHTNSNVGFHSCYW